MHQKYSGWFAVLVIVSGVFIVFSFLGDGGITGAVVGNFDESVEQSVSVSSCGTVSSDINFSFDITATGDCFVIESSDKIYNFKMANHTVLIIEEKDEIDGKYCRSLLKGTQGP